MSRPRPPHGLASFLRRAAARCCARADAGEAFVEDKGLAVAVHTRRLDDPEAAFERLLPALRDLAEQHDLVVEPGRNVIEVRSPGMDKGLVVRTLVEELDAGAFLFAGDDLGDLEAFEAVAELRRRGLPTLLVCSASDEESAARRARRRRRSRAPRASSTCSASSPPTPATCAPEPDRGPGRPACGRDVHILRRLPRVCTSSSRGTEGTAL